MGTVKQPLRAKLREAGIQILPEATKEIVIGIPESEHGITQILKLRGILCLEGLEEAFAIVWRVTGSEGAGDEQGKPVLGQIAHGVLVHIYEPYIITGLL
ncbi:hypothetical protein D3C80_1992040 [compost metagenome]